MKITTISKPSIKIHKRIYEYIHSEEHRREELLSMLEAAQNIGIEEFKNEFIKKVKKDFYETYCNTRVPIEDLMEVYLDKTTITYEKEEKSKKV